ncbi:lytic transglycosylase domain-containing protein [Magnetospira sp. QH-2]|uniref:lytic transglycosylase domain-containing protein n=1 Tax=Magnetospira sp. (strain QH-2) TaxID=1288970 RepID=UPI00130E6DDE|nr:lytic transglycosylase domain-containing protein [Magnetospira sp. QH-2]
MTRTRVFKRLGIFLLGGMLVTSGPAAWAGPSVATLPDDLPNTDSRSLAPVLSEGDVALYQEIFKLQKAAKWRAADKRIKALDNPVLMGHVQAQRYMHPTGWRSKYKELKDWMGQYADLPQAKRIYSLAVKRRPKNWKWPAKPVGTGGLDGVRITRSDASKPLPYRALSKDKRKRAKQILRTIKNRLRHGWTKSAKRMLQTKETKALLSHSQYDSLRAALGMAYLGDGRDQWALDWAGKAAKRSGKRVPSAHWIAGLAAWHLGQRERAAEHFQAIVGSRYAADDLQSAAAFWSARAALIGGEPEKVIGLLKQAAVHPRSFYGLLALELLGEDLPFQWGGDVAAVGGNLTNHDAGRRVLALVQVGRMDEAEQEVRLLARRGGPDAARNALALADRAGLAEAALRLGRHLYGHDAPETFAFPLPALNPKGGFSVDRALLFALMKQESAFNADARSHMGARGLLQLMPRTASFVAGDRKLHGAKRKTLHDPDVNLKLGQKYIRMLLEEPAVNGDVMRLIAAWNGGPGNLNKWLRANRHDGDPLLFMESIPLRETRAFVERVLTNLWIYRHRLGQPLPSLTAIAAGQWPSYIALDSNPTVVAKNGENRR